MNAQTNQPTNWLEIAKEITKQERCCYCQRLIGIGASFPRYIITDGQLEHDGEYCWNCAEQYAN